MTSMLLTLINWCSTTAPIVFVRDSRFGMPAVQAVHLVGLTVLLAAILLLNMRLAGVGMMDWSLPWLERQLEPWAMGAITLSILSGVLIFLGTPAKYLASNPFRFKMTLLCLAIAFHVGVLRRFVSTEPGPRWSRIVVAGVSVTLWFLVGWSGRAIAFIP
jgi:hypothetical protein